MAGYERVQDMFSRVAERCAAEAAIEARGKQVTYAELEAKSNNLANFLIASGATRGSIVAIMTEDVVELITAIIGVLKARCVFVPLDATLPEKRLQAMVEQISPSWFVVESSLHQKANKIAINQGSKAFAVCLDGRQAEDDCCAGLVRVGGFGAYRDTAKPAAASDPDDPCYIYFTSGSTGKPKPILGCSKGLAHFISWEVKTFGIEQGTRVSQLTAPVFDPFLRDVFVPLCAGGVLCVPDGRETLLQLGKLIDWIDIQQINLIHCVPFLFRMIVNQGLSPYYFSSLKNVLLAGEPLLPSDVKKWMDVFGEQIQLVNIYGPTETTLAKFFHIVKRSDLDRHSIPVGRPIEGANAMIVGDDGALCDTGSVGEVYIQTPFRSLGYYNQPELTQEVFIKNPFSEDPADIVYKTGDLGRILPGGDLQLLGRKDNQVKIRGVRIELHEIENLLRRHDAVTDAVVAEREGPDDQKYLCAYYVAQGVEQGAIRDFLSTHLPDYMMPSAFVAMKTLPRLPSGKADRSALPAPGEQRSELQKLYVAPRTPVEEELARIWQQVLGVKQVGIHDSFFELGGHSLSVTQLASRIWDAFQVEMPLAILFNNPTIVNMTGAIAVAQAEREDQAGVAQLLAQLRQLSPGEIKTMLERDESP
jgi:amino acid adenylation domain-containing protein